MPSISKKNLIFLLLILLPLRGLTKLIGTITEYKGQEGMDSLCHGGEIVDPLQNVPVAAGGETDQEGWNSELTYQKQKISICGQKKYSCAVKKLVPSEEIINNKRTKIPRISYRYKGSDSQFYACNFLTCRKPGNKNCANVSCYEYSTNQEIEDYVNLKSKKLRGKPIGEKNVCFNTEQAVGVQDLGSIIIPTIKMMYAAQKKEDDKNKKIQAKEKQNGIKIVIQDIDIHDGNGIFFVCNF